jgi:hypothetical protein
MKHSIGGAQFYIIYIDDCTRYTEVYFLITTSAEEISAKFQAYEAWVRARGFQIKRFWYDDGSGEYNNSWFLAILGESGITFEPSPLHPTPSTRMVLPRECQFTHSTQRTILARSCSNGLLPPQKISHLKPIRKPLTIRGTVRNRSTNQAPKAIWLHRAAQTSTWCWDMCMIPQRLGKFEASSREEAEERWNAQAWYSKKKRIHLEEAWKKKRIWDISKKTEWSCEIVEDYQDQEGK